MRSREYRTKHIDLEDSCIFIGGTGSQEFRGLMAHYLKTTIPLRKVACLCHACSNHKCSNPKHLYWGTESENRRDSIRHERGMPWSVDVSESIRKKKKVGFQAIPVERYIEVFNEIDTSQWGWVQEASNKLGVTHTQVRRVFDRLGLVGRKRGLVAEDGIEPSTIRV